MTSPTLSVVITTYNRPAMVCEAVRSVLAQTRPVTECVVVDDGSSDDPAPTLGREFGDRVKLVRQRNAGMQAARNTGIAAARGEWIAFLDDDDTWLPTRHETVAGLLADARVDIVSGNFHRWSHTGWLDLKRHFDRMKPGYFDGGTRAADADGLVFADGFDVRRLFPDHPFWPSTLFVRRDLMARAGGWEVRMAGHKAEEVEFLWRMLRAGTLGVAWPADMRYRMHPGNDAKDNNKVILGKLDVFSFIRQHHPLEPELASWLDQSIARWRHTSIFAAFDLRDFARLRSLGKAIGWRDLNTFERAKVTIATLPRPIAKPLAELASRRPPVEATEHPH